MTRNNQSLLFANIPNSIWHDRMGFINNDAGATESAMDSTTLKQIMIDTFNQPNPVDGTNVIETAVNHKNVALFKSALELAAAVESAPQNQLDS